MRCFAVVGPKLGNGGFLAYGTLDLSPQAGFNFLNSAFTSIRIDQLAELYRASLLLCRAERPDEQRPCQAVQGAYDLLTGALPYKQGVPTALGSGWAAMPYVIRALMHSRRFGCNSWLLAVKALNLTLFWVGDLGESTIAEFRADARRLFGDWIDDASAQAPAPPADASVPVDEPGNDNDIADFQFVDEDALGAPAQDVCDIGGCGDSDGALFEFLDEGVANRNDGSAHGNAEGVINDAMGVPDDDVPPWMLNFESSLYISGTLHILHNLT